MDDDEQTLEHMAQMSGIGIVQAANLNDSFSPIVHDSMDRVGNVFTTQVPTTLDLGNINDENTDKRVVSTSHSAKAVVSISWDYLPSRRKMRDHVVRQLPENTPEATIAEECRERTHFQKRLREFAFPEIKKMIARSAFQQKMTVGNDKIVQTLDDVCMAWKEWTPTDTEKLKAIFHSVEGQFLANPTWDEVMERDFMENDDERYRYEYGDDPIKTKQHKMPKKCVATILCAVRSEIKRKIIRAAENTHGFYFGKSVPQDNKPNKYWRRKAGDHSFDPLFLRHRTDPGKVENWMKNYGKQMSETTTIRTETTGNDSPTAKKQRRQVGYSKGTAGNAMEFSSSEDESEVTNKDENDRRKEIQALLNKIKMLSAQNKCQKKENEKRMSVLQNENEEMQLLHKDLNREKDEKLIKEGKRRGSQKKKKMNNKKGKTAKPNNKKRKVMDMNDDGNGMCQK